MYHYRTLLEIPCHVSHIGCRISSFQHIQQLNTLIFCKRVELLFVFFLAGSALKLLNSQQFLCRKSDPKHQDGAPNFVVS